MQFSVSADFVYTQLNVKTVLYLTIQFSVSINMLYSHHHDQPYKHICMRNHNDTIITTRDTVLLEKYTSHFIWRGCVWEGVGDRTELQHIDLPTLMAISVSFPFSRVAQPGARGPSSLLAFSTTSCLQNSSGLPTRLVSKLNRGSRGPLLPDVVFLYRIFSPNSPISKLTDFLSSQSYIIVQSPTQYLPITGHRNVSHPPSLEWYVWSSSSGNNCHAVHRSLSSGASVCDCTVEF